MNNIHLHGWPKFLFGFIFIFLGTTTMAQQPAHMRISLLTCTPGDELYSTFGHSAIRVTDSITGQDIVFNYGTFNFDDEGFYIKFIRGKLLYYVSTTGFLDFKEEYILTNRGITEQVLNFTDEEKIALRNFLYNNAKEENRYYLYDFFFDNCTTRVRDIIIAHKKNMPPPIAIVPKGTTFRQAIYTYLDKNGKDWSKLGIDILLGAPTDAVMTEKQMQFLPDNLMVALDSINNHQPIVVSSASLYPFQPIKVKPPFFTPMVVFGLLLAVIILIALSRYSGARAFLQGFDGLLFFLTGALGIVLILMWTATNHQMCRNNYNLLWALPTNVLLAFFVNSKKEWVKKAFKYTGLFLLVVMLAWFMLPQHMNTGLLPLVLLLLYRCGVRATA
jgi:hypothetical protein